MALTCRVQYLNDIDPFTYSTINFPEPPRPPVHTFCCNLPLINQIASVHRLLHAPHRVNDIFFSSFPCIFFSYFRAFAVPRTAVLRLNTVLAFRSCQISFNENWIYFQILNIFRQFVSQLGLKYLKISRKNMNNLPRKWVFHSRKFGNSRISVRSFFHSTASFAGLKNVPEFFSRRSREKFSLLRKHVDCMVCHLKVS